MTISATTAAMMNQYGAPPNSRRRNAGLPSWCRELRLLDMFGKVVAAGYRSALRVLPRREIRVRAGVAARRLRRGPSRIQLLPQSAASAKANPRQALSRTPAGSESALGRRSTGIPGRAVALSPDATGPAFVSSRRSARVHIPQQRDIGPKSRSTHSPSEQTRNMALLGCANAP